MSFLHGSYVHPFSRCGLLLRDKEGRAAVLWGETARCRHISGHVHEIGVQLEKPIDIDRFVDSCRPMEADQQQSVASPRLTGRLLYLDGSAEERERLQSHFEELGLELEASEDSREAVRAADEGKGDLILTELHLPTISGLETIELLRQQGYTGPILVLTADPETSMHEKARSRGCDAVLTKPCNVDRLVQEITRHLPQVSEGRDQPGMRGSSQFCPLDSA